MTLAAGAAAGAVAAAGFGAAALTTIPYGEDYATDRAMIEDLLGRYAFAVDFRDAEAYGAVFTEDAVLVHANGVEEGRDAIVAFSRDFVPGADDGLRPSRWGHNIMNLVLEIDGDRARGAAYWVQLTNENPERETRLGYFGHSEDEYVKVDGQWYFARREIYNEGVERRAAAGQQNPVRNLWADEATPTWLETQAAE
jgi:3-phenylpropionate/cinnamic acid dioxygenase small subunit